MALNRAQLGQAAAAPGKIEHQQLASAMRILVITDLYPPVGFGGYELECAALVRRLRRSHDVLVLTSDRDRHTAVREEDVRRALALTRQSRPQDAFAHFKRLLGGRVAAAPLPVRESVPPLNPISDEPY